MRAHHLYPLLPVSLAISLLNTAWAQAQPDAGSLRQQIEQQRTLPLPPATSPQVTTPPAKPTSSSSTSITVKSFRFSGNSLLSTEQLAQVVASYVGRPITFDDLQTAANAVAAAYRNNNRIAQVSLPAQDITDGVVTLTIVEAQYGGLRFEGNQPKRVQPGIIERFFSARQATGKPLDSAALDRALLLADDLPGVSVAGTLAAGSQQGETDLLLKVTEQAVFEGEVTADNTGARATGSERLALNLQISSPIGYGEAFNFYLLHTQGSDYGRAAISIPVGNDGLRLSANVSSMSYKVIDGPASNTPAQIKGSSGSFGIDAMYPLVRKRQHNLYLTAALDNKTFTNSDTQVRSDYANRSLSLGLSGNQFDSFGASGVNSAVVRLQFGELASMKAHNQLATIDRSYSKISYMLSRQQALGSAQSLLVSLQGQHAKQSLDSSEKFFIGGAQSVRAYPVSELGGDQAQALAAEWRWAVSSTWALSAFADVARVVTLSSAPATPKTSHDLRGYGLSVAWQAPNKLSTRLTWARRIGDNPQPTASGTDGDGTLKRNRFWLSMSMPF